MSNSGQTAENKDTSGALRWLWWLPVVSMFVMEMYVRNFDGWGAWASAPLLLVPAVVSLVIVILGLVEMVVAIHAGRLNLATLLLTLIAALPILWLGVRRFVT